MNDFIHARLLLGGKVTGYSGKYPGIAEEAYCALKAKKPLYLIGAFGGCTKAVIDSLLNGQSDLLNYDFQIQNEDYKAMFTLYNQKIQNVPDEEPIDYKKLVSFFHEKGIAGLNNGLTEEENKRLFETIHIPEMVMLVLKGLSDLTQN
ncbi:MAG TPA: TIR domain-containing protein, partial [Thermodesulfovibrionia bacterium]|nr:TIR domain-containing protein [Thermodesulfovibrionia bacterium]